jgi:hypothetical protein
MGFVVPHVQHTRCRGAGLGVCRVCLNTAASSSEQNCLTSVSREVLGHVCGFSLDSQSQIESLSSSCYPLSQIESDTKLLKMHRVRCFNHDPCLTSIAVLSCLLHAATAGRSVIHAINWQHTTGAVSCRDSVPEDDAPE